MNQEDFSISAILHQPPTFSGRSGMYPLVEALGAQPVFYEDTYKRVMKRSWTLGQWMRLFGNRYYGSTWNSLFPWLDERKLAAAMADGVDIAHFLWGEFASPANPRRFRKKARALIGTFHASERRLPIVLKGYRCLPHFDAITLMSETQRAFFVEQSVPDDRIFVLLHGVDARHFTPAPHRAPRETEPLKGLLVGSTERDHAFMAEVLRALPPGVVEMTILTAYDQRILNYKGAPHARFPEHLSDEQLLQAYREADLLVMPMLDCTANNAVLEAMACGTPVLTNRVGGMPEYVSADGNYVMNEKRVDEWVELLVHLQRNREALESRRPRVRAWAETFDWPVRAQAYGRAYARALSGTGRV